VPNQFCAGPDIDIDELTKAYSLLLIQEFAGKLRRKFEGRPHSDAGNYLCGLISFNSFAQDFVQGYSAKRYLVMHLAGEVKRA
jgi:hypothetical protein